MLFVLILTILAVVAVSFLCSLTEAVLLSLNPLELKLQEKQEARHAARWLVMKHAVERPISAILVFNTLATTGVATLAGALFTGLFGTEWLWVFSIIMSVLVLFGGEMAPKILGVHHAAVLAPRLITPLNAMIWLCGPLVALMDGFCERLKRGSKQERRLSDHVMDIITLVQAAKAEQLLHNQEEIIMVHAVTLSARRVQSAMVPLAATHFFDPNLNLEANVRALGPKLHRSYPVRSDSGTTQSQGYVRVRELFVQHVQDGGASAWQALIRPALHIEGQASLTQLLALFLEKQEVAALVDAPDGSILGWITMDDVMKVLMGARF